MYFWKEVLPLVLKKKNRESSSLEFPLRLGFGRESLEHVSSTNENLSHLATSMVCDIQCSQCLREMITQTRTLEIEEWHFKYANMILCHMTRFLNMACSFLLLKIWYFFKFCSTCKALENLSTFVDNSVTDNWRQANA